MAHHVGHVAHVDAFSEEFKEGMKLVLVLDADERRRATLIRVD